MADLEPSINSADVPGPPPPPDTASYFEKLLAYIPAEIIGAYVTMDGVLKGTASDTPYWLYWAVAGACLVLAPLYVIYRPSQTSILKCTMRFRALTSSVAIAVWIFALGGPFATLPWYRSVYGSILLVVTTLTIPVFEKIAERFKF